MSLFRRIFKNCQRESLVVRVEYPPAVEQEPPKAPPSLEVMRELAGSINVLEIDFDGETADDRRDNLQKAHTIAKDEMFVLVIKDLINHQMHFTTNLASDWEQVVFGRGSINGILLVKDAIDRLSLKFQELKEDDKKDFDEYEAT